MELEIKVMWCKGLTAFNFFQKLTIYTFASISSEDQKLSLTQEQKQEQKTLVDQDGDGNPEWNHTMKFDLNLVKSISPDFENLSLVFEFRHQVQLFPDRTIGQVSVPLRSLVESVGNEVVRFVSYEVRSPEGKHNGIFDFSYKIVGHVENHHSEMIQISGYNHQHWEHSHDHDDVNSGVHISEHQQIKYERLNAGVHETHHIRYDHETHHHHNHDLDDGQHWEHSHTHDHMNSVVHITEHQHIKYERMNAGVHMSEIHHSHYDHQTHHDLDESHQPSSSDPEKIQYPKIDMGDMNVYIPTSSAGTSVGGNVNESFHQYYPPPHAVYPPSPPPPHLWAPEPPHPPHFPHPPPPPVVYPPPPQSPHWDPQWGYHRPPEYQNQPGGDHHW